VSDHNEETRYYIGLMDGLHVMFKLGPANAESFNHGPRELIPLGETTWAYPISQKIAEEWTRDDDELDSPGGAS
jgi:hypothetical protein